MGIITSLAAIALAASLPVSQVADAEAATAAHDEPPQSVEVEVKVEVGGGDDVGASSIEWLGGKGDFSPLQTKSFTKVTCPPDNPVLTKYRYNRLSGYFIPLGVEIRETGKMGLVTVVESRYQDLPYGPPNGIQSALLTNSIEGPNTVHVIMHCTKPGS